MSQSAQWVVAGVIFVVGVVGILKFMDSPAERERKSRAELIKWQDSRAIDDAQKKAKIEGAQALEAADNAIRQEALDRRLALEKASTRTSMSNKNGVRIDRYFLKRGGVITCTTTISGNSPAMFICDGNL